MPTILVTGAQGQLGSEIKGIAALHTEYSFDFVDKEEMPLL